MRVAVIGTGYVGLVSGACLAELGHDVTCVDVDAGKIERLRRGEIPLYEQGLEEIVKRNCEHGRLHFTTSCQEAVPGADVISIAVGTPSASDGSADMQYVWAAAEDVGRTLTSYAVIATKSTVPVGTAEEIRKRVSQVTQVPFDVVSNPETLREGRAVYDFLHPSRVIIGSDSGRATETMLNLFTYLDCPKVVTDPRSSELTKYASNAFLATKISFMNEIAHLCELVGANVDDVARGMGLDPRIGKEFLRVGPGYGGSCFPKDTRALSDLGRQVGARLSIVNSAIDANEHARHRVVDRLEKALGSFVGKHVALLGLAFKGNTDDTRESPAVSIAKILLERGASIRAHDPIVRVAHLQPNLTVTEHPTPYAAAQGSHALIIATEWEEFRALDLAKLKAEMAGSVIMDARNLLNAEDAVKHGFTYLRVGRKS